MIGVDLLRVDRILKLIDLDKKNKVFSVAEKKYADAKSDVVPAGQVVSHKSNCYAGLYAAKEAFLKALGLGIGGKLTMADVEIGHETSGQPYVIVTDKISSVLKQYGMSKVSISISHDDNHVIAVAQIS